MTSLFDFPDPILSGDMPIDLMAMETRGVEPLEFFVVGEEERIQQEHAAHERAEEDARQAATKERHRQLQVMLDAARTEAAAHLRQGLEAEMHEALSHDRTRVDKLCMEFARDRQRYFAAAEAQVVKLALAMARRVLQREIEVDPMHLLPVVRAALARVQDGSASVLRVRSEEVEQWAAIFHNAQDGHVSVIADDRLGAGACVLQTDVGRVEMGVDVQMQEVERGVNDLLRRQGE